MPAGDSVLLFANWKAWIRVFLLRGSVIPISLEMDVGWVGSSMDGSYSRDMEIWVHYPLMLSMFWLADQVVEFYNSTLSFWVLQALRQALWDIYKKELELFI